MGCAHRGPWISGKLGESPDEPTSNVRVVMSKVGARFDKCLRKRLVGHVHVEVVLNNLNYDRTALIVGDGEEIAVIPSRIAKIRRRRVTD
jgi:hypothetical protein